MNKNYENLKISVIKEDVKFSMLFSDKLNNEFEVVLKNQEEMELLSWLISKHTKLYQGRHGEIDYDGKLLPIKEDNTEVTLDIIQKLRNNQPIKNNLDNIRKIILELSQEAERLEYIFCTHVEEPIVNRFGWLYALLSDIRTCLDGFAKLNDVKLIFPKDIPLGGGNLSIPILVCTGLELLSALYSGKTKYLNEKNYNAEENVIKFINDFFPEHVKRIPRILWDSVRNGIDHMFIPKPVQCAQYRINFIFRRDVQSVSDIIRRGNTIFISIAAISFYTALRQAIENYKNVLQKDEILQCNFINAWSSIEEYSRNITNDENKVKELKHLLDELNRNDKIELFKFHNEL